MDKKLTADMERLDDLLIQHPAKPMMLGTLDGFLAGVALCPEQVPVEAWLPQIWMNDDAAWDDATRDNADEDGAEEGGPPADAPEPRPGPRPDQGPELPPEAAPELDPDQLVATLESLLDTPETEELMTRVLQHYEAVCATLRDPAQNFMPIFGVDPRDGETVIWETWIDGFRQAISLNPDAWAPVADGDYGEAARAALNGVMVLDQINRGESDLPDESVQELSENAPVVIEMVLRSLRAAMHGPVLTGGRPAVSNKIGRNAPCPCGSGKKYKKCCMRN